MSSSALTPVPTTKNHSTLKNFLTAFTGTYWGTYGGYELLTNGLGFLNSYINPCYAWQGYDEKDMMTYYESMKEEVCSVVDGYNLIYVPVITATGALVYLGVKHKEAIAKICKKPVEIIKDAYDKYGNLTNVVAASSLTLAYATNYLSMSLPAILVYYFMRNTTEQIDKSVRKKLEGSFNQNAKLKEKDAKITTLTNELEVEKSQSKTLTECNRELYSKIAELQRNKAAMEGLKQATDEQIKNLYKYLEKLLGWPNFRRMVFESHDAKRYQDMLKNCQTDEILKAVGERLMEIAKEKNY